MREPVWVGLCGRSGAGKGYVSGLFAKLGVPAVDTDAVYRAMTAPADSLSPCMRDLHDAFGSEIVLPDNSLDRRRLAAIVFAPDGTERLKKLNEVTHKHILAETRRIAGELAEQGAKCILIDAPVLFESGFDAFCTCTLGVVCSEAKSVSRIIRRDGVTEEEARRRLASQLSVEELRRRCTFIIVNESTEEVVMAEVRKTYEAICRYFRV